MMKTTHLNKGRLLWLFIGLCSSLTCIYISSRPPPLISTLYLAATSLIFSATETNDRSAGLRVLQRSPYPLITAYFANGQWKPSPFHWCKVARLFDPAIFEASKLRVLFLGVDEKKHPGNLPRAYTLTHCDITSKLTLAISQTINNAQLKGWYNRLQRDEVIAEWKKVKDNMSLHVHCHISGGHFLLDLCAKLRFFIFSKELPVVLKAFVHGDENLFKNYPELKEALVWVYFHSNLPEFNRAECWGPLKDAAALSNGGGGGAQNHNHKQTSSSNNWVRPEACPEDCTCCFPPTSLITWSEEFPTERNGTHQSLQQQM